MTNNAGKPNPKALKLEGLGNVNKKVTVGFKCHPQLKFHLAMEANKLGLTLSEFVETLIQQLENAVKLEKEITETLKQQIAFYENEILLKLFKEHKGQEIKFLTTKGENLKIAINEPKDIFTVLINSFKFKK